MFIELQSTNHTCKCFVIFFNVLLLNLLFFVKIFILLLFYYYNEIYITNFSIKVLIWTVYQL